MKQQSSNKRVTIKDLANEVGLSLGAVSQALNPRESTIKVRAETIKRVQEVARRMGYRPHAGASSIRSKHFQNVGYFIATHGIPEYEPIDYQIGLHDAALEHNFRVTLVRLPSDLKAVKNAVSRVFMESHLDVLVMVNASVLFAEYREILQGCDFPIIYLNDKHANNSVYSDDISGAKQAVEHLISRGHRKIYFVKIQNSPLVDTHYSIGDRIQGYTEAMQTAGLTPVIKTYRYPQEDGRLCDELFGKDRPDAILGYSDADAAQLLKFAYRQGLHAPQDIAIMGYNDDIFSRHSWVTISTMRLPAYDMAQAAFKMGLTQMSENNLGPSPSRIFVPELIVRGSTAPEALTPVPFPMDPALYDAKPGQGYARPTALEELLK